MATTDRASFDEPGARQVGPPEIAGQHDGPAAHEGPQPGSHPLGELLLVPQVPDEHDIPAVVGPDRVGLERVDLDAVGRGVEAGRLDRENLDVDRGHVGRSRKGRGDRHDATAAADVDDGPAADKLGVIEDVAGQGQATGPRPGPVRGWDGRSGIGERRGLPERHGEAALTELDLGHERRTLGDRVLEDERLAVVGSHPRSLTGRTIPR